MSRTARPEDYPLSKVRSHILKMPLHYLSNSGEKFFSLDREVERFILKEGRDGRLRDYWNDGKFRAQERDRITFALKTYFFKKGLKAPK